MYGQILSAFICITLQVFAFLKIEVNILPAFPLLSAADWAYERK